MDAQTQSRSIYVGRIDPTPVIAVCYWLLMLVTGTDILDASLLSVAIAFGLMSISAAGGIKTGPGLLNFVLVLKFLLVAVVMKAFTGQASDSILRAPRTTCEVMAVGFFAVYLGSLAYRHAFKTGGVVGDVVDAHTYLALTGVFCVATFGSAMAILIFQVSYATNLSGGLWGLAHQCQAVLPFCVVPALYYAWSSGSKRFLSHPLVVAIMAAEIIYGIASTTKQAIMEPVLCYLGVGFIRYGLRSKAVWSVVMAGAFAYISVVYPYSQYVRDHGGRDGSLQERWETIQEVFFNVSTDSDFREMVDTNLSGGEYYLDRESLRPISRLAMIGEADRLIAATDSSQSYTGWSSIINGLKLMVPSFLMPDKPTSADANMLAHIVGDVSQDDLNTQVSYGFMANLYNAFGLWGVLIGSSLLIFVLYYVLRLWFADHTLTFGPWGSSIWYVLLGLLFEHSLVEAPVGGILPSFFNIVVIVALIVVARLLPNMLSLKPLRSQSH